MATYYRTAQDLQDLRVHIRYVRDIARSHHSRESRQLEFSLMFAQALRGSNSYQKILTRGSKQSGGAGFKTVGSGETVGLNTIILEGRSFYYDELVPFIVNFKRLSKSFERVLEYATINGLDLVQSSPYFLMLSQQLRPVDGDLPLLNNGLEPYDDSEF